MDKRKAFWLLCLAALVLLAGGCKSLFLAKGYPDYQAELAGLPVHGPVKVLRDDNGIPHIYAQDRHDLLVAQGYVHAQDRLWQMETLRRVATGRLAEIAGEARLDLDYFARLLGFAELRRRAAAVLEAAEIAELQAYVEGINAYIRLRSEDLPLEFRSAGLVPEPWQVEDVFSFIVVTSWMFRENYRAELTVLAGRQKVTLQEWKDIFPAFPGAMLPDDGYFEQLRGLKLGPIKRSALAFFQALPEAVGSAGGTNLWVTARGPGGKPLLANDTHIGISLPGTWYLCHLSAPGVDIVGASAPGVPGVMLGHTQSVAWGMAILPIDFVDLFVVRVDPADPTRYYVGDQILTMEREELVFAVKGGQSQKMPAYRTIYGPVITELEPGIEGAVALKWYGTLPDGELTDATVSTSLGFMDCRSVADVMQNVRHTRLVGLNFLAADVQGNIAWQSTGAVPIRKGYSGRLPVDGSSGAMGWDGFLPFEEMPATLNPPEGVIVNCNNRVLSGGESTAISNSWGAPYRYERVMSLLRGQKEPSVDEFRKMQMDVYSLQAEALLPKVLAYAYADKEAAEAAEALKGWDRQVRAASREAAVYEVFLTEFVRALLGDELGDDLFYYYHVMFKQYLIQDVILDRPDSGLWDRKDTPQKEGPREILEMALSATVRTLEAKLGTNRRNWSWGRLHPVEWRHAGATSRFKSRLLNSGPFPADGDGTTLNANTPIVARGEYRAIHIPALRMVVSMDDLDGMQIIAPMGQSGQPGHRHYDDLVRRWLEGSLVDLPFNRERVDDSAKFVLTLNP
jgi:penicillin amidase